MYKYIHNYEDMRSAIASFNTTLATILFDRLDDPNVFCYLDAAFCWTAHPEGRAVWEACHDNLANDLHLNRPDWHDAWAQHLRSTLTAGDSVRIRKPSIAFPPWVPSMDRLDNTIGTVESTHPAHVMVDGFYMQYDWLTPIGGTSPSAMQHVWLSPVATEACSPTSKKWRFRDFKME